ncbi:MAG: hypothetical protein AAF514_09085, partial [Verrucomicrobiota bacterium]
MKRLLFCLSVMAALVSLPVRANETPVLSMTDSFCQEGCVAEIVVRLSDPIDEDLVIGYSFPGATEVLESRFVS